MQTSNVLLYCCMTELQLAQKSMMFGEFCLLRKAARSRTFHRHKQPLLSTCKEQYQGGHIWGQALIAQPEYPDPSSWGWKKEQSGTSTTWTPLWSTLAPASATCIELLCCGCTKGCHGRCKCRRASLKCTDLCKCAGDCSN